MVTAKVIVENRAIPMMVENVYLGQTSLGLTIGILAKIPKADWCPTIVATQVGGGMHGVSSRLVEGMGGMKLQPALFLVAQQVSVE